MHVQWVGGVYTAQNPAPHQREVLPLYALEHVDKHLCCADFRSGFMKIDKEHRLFRDQALTNSKQRADLKFTV